MDYNLWGHKESDMTKQSAQGYWDPVTWHLSIFISAATSHTQEGPKVPSTA